MKDSSILNKGSASFKFNIKTVFLSAKVWTKGTSLFWEIHRLEGIERLDHVKVYGKEVVSDYWYTSCDGKCKVTINHRFSGNMSAFIMNDSVSFQVPSSIYTLNELDKRVPKRAEIKHKTSCRALSNGLLLANAFIILEEELSARVSANVTSLPWDWSKIRHFRTGRLSLYNLDEEKWIS
jgi:hypothetical protein